MNQVILIGHSGSDVQMYNGGTEKKTAVFSLATNFSYTNKTGQRVDNVSWHNCVAFGYVAEFLSTRLKKGMKVVVNGRLEYTKYIDKDGIERTNTQVVCVDVDLITLKSNADVERKEQN